jgi:hypothetical protein
MPTLSMFFYHSGNGWRIAFSVLLLVAVTSSCGLESDGSRKTPQAAAIETETEAETASQAEHKTEPRPGAQTAVSGGASASPENSKKSLALHIEVLTQPGLGTELQVWTAGHMAGLYPVESAEMLGTTLEAADPKVVIALIDGLTLDAGGRVRTALESLESHSDSQVAKAARKKLSASN